MGSVNVQRALQEELEADTAWMKLQSLQHPTQSVRRATADLCHAALALLAVSVIGTIGRVPGES